MRENRIEEKQALIVNAIPEKISDSQRVVLQYSGGKDSTACLLFLLNKGYEVKAIHFVHRYGYSIPTEEAKRICQKYHIELKIIDITQQMEQKFLKDGGYKGRPCRLCKGIMDKITVEFAISVHVNLIATGDTGSDTGLIQRIKGKDGTIPFYSRYFNEAINLPEDILIYRPLINFLNNQICELLIKYHEKVKRIGDTGDKYFEYSREGCPLQFKDLGEPYTKELLTKLQKYSLVCSAFAREKGIRASVHLPSGFIVTIPKGYEEQCRVYLNAHDCPLPKQKNEISKKKYISAVIKIRSACDQEFLIYALKRMMELLEFSEADIDSESNDELTLTAQGNSLYCRIKRNDLLINLCFSTWKLISKTSIENLIIEIFHTYDFKVLTE